jgi:hypothetical protein
MLVASCSPKSNETTPAEQPTQASSQAEKPAGVIPAAQQQALEKAKQTDDMVIEATEKRMKDAE